MTGKEENFAEREDSHFYLLVPKISGYSITHAFCWGSGAVVIRSSCLNKEIGIGIKEPLLEKSGGFVPIVTPSLDSFPLQVYSAVS